MKIEWDGSADSKATMNGRTVYMNHMRTIVEDMVVNDVANLPRESEQLRCVSHANAAFDFRRFLRPM